MHVTGIVTPDHTTVRAVGYGYYAELQCADAEEAFARIRVAVGRPRKCCLDRLRRELEAIQLRLRGDARRVDDGFRQVELARFGDEAERAEARRYLNDAIARQDRALEKLDRIEHDVRCATKRLAR